MVIITSLYFYIVIPSLYDIKLYFSGLQVLVESLNTGRTLMFPCGQWLEDEGALFKILYPGREGGTGRGHHGGRDDPDDMHTGRRKGKLGQ